MAEKITIQQLDRINPADTQGVASRTIQRKFGKSNDYIEFHVYDQNDKLLYSIDNYRDYEFPSMGDSEDEGSGAQLTSTLFVDPTRTLTELGFTSGIYSVIMNFQRKKFFNSLDLLFKIDEVSPSRTELKLSTTYATGLNLERLFNRFSDEMLSSIIYKDFLLCFGNNRSFIGVNVALDKNNPKNYKILIKLFEPLSADLDVGDDCRITEEIINPIEFKINLGTPKRADMTLPIKWKHRGNNRI